MWPKAWLVTALVLLLPAAAAAIPLDESPAGPGDLGYRPAAGSVSAVNPPSFSWRPAGRLTWEVQVAKDAAFADLVYLKSGIEFSVHCPPRAFPPGDYRWRYRGTDRKGRKTDWSRDRSFTIPADAAEMPLPPRAELLSKVPRSHPRLFLRPEDLPRLRKRARGDLKPQFQSLVRACRKLLAAPPSVEEPPRYSEGIVRGSDPWREVWWGNRRRVIAALDGAATLAFTRLLGGPEEFGAEAKRILLACARWDPEGSTSYRYNDEAGMPYAYYFSRTCTFLWDLLTEKERDLCRRVMRVRAEQMYRHLCPRHLWRPYSSHSNRAWHFLGEVGIAFYGEIEGAADWIWFATNVFFNAYPVWSDDDGGWHEGANYWSSYQGRFTWWADVMRAALGINAYDKPYYAKAGDYAMFLMPPGKVGGGFGDLTAKVSSARIVPLMTTLAAQAGNPRWQWWVEKCGGPRPAGGYVGFVRGALPKTVARPPAGAPTSRLFRGIGQAVLNSRLDDAKECVQVVLKSSPFGTQSHGYEANNAFLLFAYGKRLLIRSGYRDSYGSAHHRKWMWSPRSVNTITADGKAQPPHSAASRGEIATFRTTESMDLVVGRAGGHTRAILFFKPDTILVFDRIRAKGPVTFEYRLHAVEKFDLRPGQRVVVRNGNVACRIRFLSPAGLEFEQTDQYDPNPRPRIKLREWHLTAVTPRRTPAAEFVTLLRPVRRGRVPEVTASHRRIDGGQVVTVRREGEILVALLPTFGAPEIEAEGMRSNGRILMARKQGGRIVERVSE